MSARVAAVVAAVLVTLTACGNDSAARELEHRRLECFVAHGVGAAVCTTMTP
jgi:hypothetical protein